MTYLTILVITLVYIYIYILFFLFNCLCGSVSTASDTQAVGHGFDPRPDH